MKFLIENFWLVGLAFGSGAMLLWPMLRGSAGGAQEATPSEAVLLINRENALVLDVRDEDEYAAGHIVGAKHIPSAQLAERLNELRKYQQKPLLVHCQSGVRSTSACAQLKQAGHTRLYNLKGGFNAWKQANLPVEKA